MSNAVYIKICDTACRMLMSKRLTSKEFLELADILWQGKVKVKYQNPDSWAIY